MIITIDGPSGTGKSTVAKEVAKRLGFTFFDTGAMYRSFAWKVLRCGIEPSDVQEVVKLIDDFRFEIQTDKSGMRLYFVDGIDVTDLIRSRDVTNVSSQIAVYPEVRQAIVKMQRKFGRSSNAVFEGRDMGTVVFPKADVKIFLTANSKIRAERRFRELSVKFPDLVEPLSLDQIYQEMEARDKNDTTRAISPLQKAQDAHLIDTSYMTIEQVVKEIIRLKPEREAKPRMSLMYRFAHGVSCLFFNFFFHLKILGQNRVRPGHGIFIANHTSFYDPFVVAVSVNDEVHFLTKDNLFERSFIGKFIRDLNTHALTDEDSEFKIMKNMIKLLEKGKKLIFFPEGKKSPTGELDVFTKELVLLARKANCPVYPIYLHGVYNAWPCTKKIPKFFGKIVCVFGNPIYFDEFEEEKKSLGEEKFLKKCRDSVLELKNWLDAGMNSPMP